MAARDVHSYSEPGRILVRHVDLDLDVRFDRRILEGAAPLAFERIDRAADSLVLDTRGLDIAAAEAPAAGGNWRPVEFSLGAAAPILGAPLRIALPADADRVRVRYATRPGASGLQWLSPPQTAGRTHPFLFSQSQAIHARSWIPIQDTPPARLTYGPPDTPPPY